MGKGELFKKQSRKGCFFLHFSLIVHISVPLFPRKPFSFLQNLIAHNSANVLIYYESISKGISNFNQFFCTEILIFGCAFFSIRPNTSPSFLHISPPLLPFMIALIVEYPRVHLCGPEKGLRCVLDGLWNVEIFFGKTNIHIFFFFFPFSFSRFDQICDMRVCAHALCDFQVKR